MLGKISLIMFGRFCMADLIWYVWIGNVWIVNVWFGRFGLVGLVW